MAGYPIRRQQEAHLTEHEIEVFQDRANGLSWRKLAAKWGTSLFVLDKWLKAKDAPERWPAWKALDEIAAEAKAGEAEEILDAVESETLMGSERVRLAVAKSELAKWHAGVLNRARFGTANQQGGITLNVGTMHLPAIRDLNLNPPPPPQGLLDGTLDVEAVVIETPREDATLAELLGEA